ncbi:DUF222 domain-containing protein [Brevibacterium sp. Re57]|uniref:DUF222 domain-containing protein n=1 Tax=Brevibacterium gallinarum TaxID=2762220 RepID=A0ABR8WS93_9MICO|nr:DUF222 domain-containing protein [Brevibacterium gallinarum]
MSAEPESGIGAGSSAAEFLTAADTESIAQHCPEILTAIHALDTANATIGNSAAVDGFASLAMGKGLELLRRKLESAMASNTRVMVDEVDPPQYGARRLPHLLRQTMRISASGATRRLRMASWLTPRRTLSGQPVPAQLPEAGGSMAAGLLSVEQAQEVIKQIEMLPARVRSEHGPAVEKLLVDNAPDLQVTDVRALGARVRGHLDPDGRLAAEPAHPDEYFVSVKQKTNGDWRLSGLLDATTGLTLNALLTNRQQNPADIVA